MKKQNQKNNKEENKKKKLAIILPLCILGACAVSIPPAIIFTRSSGDTPSPSPTPTPEPVFIETFKFNGTTLLGFNDEITDTMIKERFADGNLIIPECSVIAENAFNGKIPDFITSITFTSSVNDIGDNAFSNNKSINLIDVTKFNDVPSWIGKDIFVNCNVSGQVEVVNSIKKKWKDLFESNSGLKIGDDYWVIGHNIFDLANCVSFKANEDSVIQFRNSGTNKLNLKYSFGEGEGQDMPEEMQLQTGSTVYLWGDNPKGFTSSTLSTSGTFYIRGNIALGGNVMGLINNGFDPSDTIPCDECFKSLFANCEGIRYVLKDFLPATNLTKECYSHMFQCCSYLENTPDLPATVMKEKCYEYMFHNLPITTTPELPAEELADSCYQCMFYHCTKLLEAKKLPAKKLKNSCYMQMFRQCSKLLTGPEIMAEELEAQSMQQMFDSCKNLNQLSIHFDNWNDAATLSWVSGVTSEGQITCPTNLEKLHGENNIPKNWTIVNS